MHRVWGFCWALLLSLLSSSPLLCHAKEQAYFQDAQFNEGKYGNYPKRSFKTSNLEPPRPNIMRNFSDCDDGSYIFVAPRGHAAKATFFILDHNLEMVWGPDHRYGKVYNFQVQHYKDEPYLFFWAGDDSVGGHGEGKYYMLNQHYEEHKKISAGDGLRGDLHSFFITRENTAVYTGYELMQADLTSVGKGTDNWIWEGLFQELDIDTGKVIFEWRASQHFNFTDVYVKPNAATKNRPWDWFHINMVDKDKAGNYLVSTRYGRCALYVSKDTGEVLWSLGGTRNSFEDLSDGKATTFLGQHDIHWDGENAITMFDNRADWFNKFDDESIGHRIVVDLKKMTAKLAQSFYHPNHILSTSQGSMQTLPNGHVLMGYGYNGVFTEFDAKGNCLCDVTFLPHNRMGSGDVQNYRALKFNWTGMPLSVPDLVHEDGVLYMSWLGATKVKSWSIEHSDVTDEDFKEAQVVKKDGFETEVILKDGPVLHKYIRVVALDGKGKHLSTSRPVDLNDPADIWGDGGTSVSRPSTSTSNNEDSDGEGNEPEPDPDFDGGEKEVSHHDDYYDDNEAVDYEKENDDAPIEDEKADADEGAIEDDQSDPWDYGQAYPDDDKPTGDEEEEEEDEPVTEPPKQPQRPQEPEDIKTAPAPKPDQGSSDGSKPDNQGTSSNEVTHDQILLVFGVVFAVGAALAYRIFCWRRQPGYRSVRFWGHKRHMSNGSASKMAYAYGELPTSEREQ